jgi:signal transduction histidine kinase/DNA-binding transcriptional MerR regulator
VTESTNLQSDVPLKTSIPGGAVSLESILCTEELPNRPWRLPDHEKENSALVALTSALADSPRTILQTLADKVLEILHADSAGLSLLTKDEKRFYWAAIAGAWRPHIGGGTPRDFGPCGDVLDHNIPMLFTHWERRYPYLSTAMPLADEGLLVPFYVNGKAVGTIWAIAHNNRRKFDAEDLRLLESMSRFASAAYQAVESIEDLKLEIAAREKAETELSELNDGLEAQVRVRTEELEQRNKQLADARARLAEEKLRLERSEAYMAEAQRLSHTGSWHLNVRTGELVWSQEFFAILGFDSEKTKPSYPLFLERIHPEDRSKFDQVRSAAIGEKKDYEIEYRLLLPGGLIKHVHGIGHCSASQSADIEYIAAAMDITERKRAQEELRRSEAFLAEGQHLSRTGSFSWRVATDEITWSEQLYRIFEFDQGVPVTLELIGTRIHPEDLSAFEEHIERSRQDGSAVQLEFRLQMPDHSVKHLHVVAHGTRDQNGRLEYIGAVQDVTERRLSEEALSKVRSELAHVARVTSLGVLTASIAHEVNQPLSGIITNASTCLRMLAADPPNIDGARETARRTVRDGNRASEVITRLRGLFSKKDPTIESVDLNEATREVIALSLSKLRGERVSLRTELADDLPPVTGDRVQLQQVILNLLQNASDAMSAVDGCPRKLLIKTERDERDHVRLTMQDAGVGFEPENQDKLFEAFYSSKSDGMGIGLSVSRSIIESHRGRLWAAPNDGPGATFAFSIPCRSECMTGADSCGATHTPAVTEAQRVTRSL